MQKNDAGFKMSFKKRNPDFKRPPKKVPATTIPAGGDLRKHDQPTKALEKSRDSDSSSEEDVLEQKRKAELENQKSEQAKLVEMALLEQVMNGKIDVMDLLRSGEDGNATIRDKIQKQLLDGIPASQTSSAKPVPLKPIQTPVQPSSSSNEKATPINPLMRNRASSTPEKPSKSSSRVVQKKETSSDRATSKNKTRVESTDSISSESSEDSSSESSILSGISSESDSDVDSHKLAKKVKKLKTKNRKLRKRVKTLKKRLKDRKTENNREPSISKQEPSKVPRSTEESERPIFSTQSLLEPPLTPQQFAAKQAQLRKQYDPKTGKYRDTSEGQQPASIPPPMPIPPVAMPPFHNFPPPIPGMMPPIPPMPYGHMMPLAPPLATVPIQPPAVSTNVDNDGITITEVKPMDTQKSHFLTDDDLYTDVFKGKEQKKTAPKSQSTYTAFSQPAAMKAGVKGNDIIQVSVAPSKKKPVEIHNIESDGSELSQSDDDKDSASRKRKDSKDQVFIRSEEAKELVKDFYEDEEDLAVVGENKEGEAPTIKKSSEGMNARGVHFSGRCIFCSQYHTVPSKGEHTSLCAKGALYKNKTRDCSFAMNKLRKNVNENTEKLVSLKNKKGLMEKIMVQNNESKSKRSQEMEKFKNYIAGLPQPVKVSQEFGRKVVEAHHQQALGNRSQLIGNSVPRAEPQLRGTSQERLSSLERHAPQERPYSNNEDDVPLSARRKRQASESEHRQSTSGYDGEYLTSSQAGSHGRVQSSAYPAAGPPLPSLMGGHPPAPPRVRMRSSAAAGPPQRPPPHALLRTPTSAATGGPLLRAPAPRPGEYVGPRYQTRPLLRHGWSGDQPR